MVMAVAEGRDYTNRSHSPIGVNLETGHPACDMIARKTG